MKETTVSVSEFKAKCLGLLDEIAVQGKTLTITRHGRPIARVTPVAKPSHRLRGSWKSIVRVRGDIVHFNVADEWETNQ